MSAATLAEGDLIAGKYRLGRPLGAGGMARVYEAEHIDLGTRLALKVLDPELARSKVVVQRFSREAQAAAQIENEHVARVVDVGEHLGQPFIVMERLEGEDLAARLRRSGPLAVDEAADLLLQAAEALAEAHARGIIHRDIKPSNLFVAKRPPANTSSLKVLDFGIAKAVTPKDGGELTRTSDVLGSPLYMSPEQLLGSAQVGPPSDVWAIGVVLQELLTGEPPFDGPSVAAIHAAILERAPEALPRVVPVEIASIVARCLRKNPNERYATMLQLASALAPHGTDEARASLSVVEGWSRHAFETARQTAAVSDRELDAMEDTEVPTTPRPGTVTDTSWDTDADPPRRGRGLIIGAAALLFVGWLVYLVFPHPAPKRLEPAAPIVVPAPLGTSKLEEAPEDDLPAATSATASSTASQAVPVLPARPFPRPVVRPPPPPPPVEPPPTSPYDTPR